MATLRSGADLPESIKPVSLTLIDPKAMQYATTVTDKRELLAAVPPNRKMIVVWTGQYRSDAFEITAREANARMQ
jgi:hypothetical protein